MEAASEDRLAGEAGQGDGRSAFLTSLKASGRRFLEGLLVLLGYAGLAAYRHSELAFHPQSWLVGTGSLHPSDSNGTLWFYWWFQRAFDLKQPLLFSDRLCAPVGQFLGRNFPNRIDAWLALPFFELLPFPASYSLFVLAVLVLGALSAYLLLRRFTSMPWLAWCGGALFGFNAYSYWEIQGGRPVTALVATLPLFLWAFLEAVEARSTPRALVLALLAGALGALVVNHYILFALFLLLAGLLLGLFALLKPAEGVPRWRVPLVGLLVALVGGSLSGPYLYEVLVVRTVEGPLIQRSSDVPEIPSFYEPQLWQRLLVERKLPTPISSAQQSSRPEALWRDLQEQSQPWTWLWHRPTGEFSRRVSIAPPIWVGALLVLAWAGRARSAWFSVALLSWLITLGPFAAWQAEKQGVRWLELGSARLALPVHRLVTLLPEVGEYLRPYRAYPLLLLALLVLLISGSSALSNRLETWLERRRARDAGASLLASGWPYPPDRALARAGIGVVATLVLLMSFWHLNSRHEFDLPVVPWAPSPFLATLQAMDDAVAVIEMPMGAGHAIALPQLVHQHRRSEPHHDAGTQLFNSSPPVDCYQHAFLRELWSFERAAARGQALNTLSGASLQSAVAAGFRYILVYPEAYVDYGVPGRPRDSDWLVDALRAQLGDPVWQDTQVVAFALSPP